MSSLAGAIGVVEVSYYRDGKLTRRDTFKNRLTFHAVSSSARLWVGESVLTPSYIVLGTGTPPPPLEGPTPDDTALWAPDPTTQRNCDVKTTFLATTSEFGVNYDQGEIAGVKYTEAGLFDDAGNMWAHVMVNIEQDETETAVVLWKILHVGN